jgi:hypothetical protein
MDEPCPGADTADGVHLEVVPPVTKKLLVDERREERPVTRPERGRDGRNPAVDGNRQVLLRA